MQIESIIWVITTLITLWGIFQPAIGFFAAPITSGNTHPYSAGHNLRLEQEGLSGKTKTGFTDDNIKGGFKEHNKGPLSEPESMDRGKHWPSKKFFMGVTEEQAHGIIEMLNNAKGGQEVPLHEKLEKLWNAWKMRPKTGN